MRNLPDNIAEIRSELNKAGWFSGPGVWAVVDGQFGSTGKGLASSVLAQAFGLDVQLVTSNAGPNSGHTSYHGDEKVVLKQLPTYAVMTNKFYGMSPAVQMNAGAIIDPDGIMHEIAAHSMVPHVMVHPHAAKVDDEARDTERQLVRAIGSTGKGTGAALARKVMRVDNAVCSHNYELPVGVWDSHNLVTFMEISQGFSLSLNASGMYPYTTSRDCTVAQGISDAGLHPTDYRDCMMVVRTHPIRVAGNSGPCYSDQKEISWSDIGVGPEFTTVTNKVRRVFTWSGVQYKKALWANKPGAIFVNFVNYLKGNEDEWIWENVVQPYNAMFHRHPVVLVGRGPYNEDVKVWG